MGYDLFVLTVRAPNERVTPPAIAAKWERKGEGWVYSKKSGQVVINDPEVIETENIPEKVTDFMPELRFSTEINVEGKASSELYAVALHAAKKLAGEFDGVVLDWQEGLMLVPITPPHHQSER
jgi:hypothetical protein